MVELVIGFVSFEVVIRGMSPPPIQKVYLGSVNGYFGSLRIRNGFDGAIKSFYVKYVLRGFLKIHSDLHPRGEAKKLAFTIELVQYVDAALVGSRMERKTNPLFVYGVKLAMKFGIYFLMRKSEFLPGRVVGGDKVRKGLPFKWINFTDREGREISWEDVKPSRAQAVSINIKKSKTDQYGNGRIVRHNRVVGKDCIVRELEKWIVMCRDVLGATPKDRLFQVGEHPIVKDDDVAAAMKLVVVHLGWDPSKVSAHSLRYGGATMLAAAGIPQYLIEYFGG